MAEILDPIVVNLGKTRSKKIRKLKRNGTGRLMDEVMDTFEQVRADMGAEADGKEFVPVLLVYNRPRKRSKGMKMKLPLKF
jgi:hypothetical protein